jgi:hypothetical protein
MARARRVFSLESAFSGGPRARRVGRRSGPTPAGCPKICSAGDGYRVRLEQLGATGRWRAVGGDHLPRSLHAFAIHSPRTRRRLLVRSSAASIPLPNPEANVAEWIRSRRVKLTTRPPKLQHPAKVHMVQHREEQEKPNLPRQPKGRCCPPRRWQTTRARCWTRVDSRASATTSRRMAKV